MNPAFRFYINLNIILIIFMVTPFQAQSNRTSVVFAKFATSFGLWRFSFDTSEELAEELPDKLLYKGLLNIATEYHCRASCITDLFFIYEFLERDKDRQRVFGFIKKDVNLILMKNEANFKAIDIFKSRTKKPELIKQINQFEELLIQFRESLQHI